MELIERFGIGLLVVSVASAVLSGQIIDRKASMKIRGVKAYAGDDIRLPCGSSVSRKLFYVVTWMKQKDNETIKLARKEFGIVINLGPRSYGFVGREDLFIPKLTNTDTGLYSCQIAKGKGEVLSSTNVNLNVKETCSWPELSPELQLHPRSCGEEFIIEGEKCSFQCKKGYQITQNATVSCLQDGRFSAPIPSCQAVNCTIGKFGSHLRSKNCQEYGSVPFGTACYFSCDLNFRLWNGDVIRTCQANATLSGRAVLCEETYTQSTSFILLMVVVSLIVMIAPIYIVYQRSQQHQGIFRRISTED